MRFARSKYGNRKVELDGFRFDSRAEVQRYTELRLLERAGHISVLTVHPRYELQPRFQRRDLLLSALRDLWEAHNDGCPACVEAGRVLRMFDRTCRTEEVPDR